MTYKLESGLGLRHTFPDIPFSYPEDHLFDLDYNFNRDVKDNLDYSTHEYVEKVFLNDSEDIFSKNALRFFEKLNSKIKYNYGD